MNIEMNINGEANIENSEALIIAARDGDIDTVEELLELEFPEIDVNMQDDDGNTALMLAAENGHIDIVYSLLDYFVEGEFGIDQMVYTAYRNAQGRNALMLAVMNNHYDISEKLLHFLYTEDSNFSFDLEDIDGNTVLMLAQATGNNELVNLVRRHLPDNNINTDTNYADGTGTNTGNYFSGGTRRRRKTYKVNKRKRSTRRKDKRSRRSRRRALPSSYRRRRI